VVEILHRDVTSPPSWGPDDERQGIFDRGQLFERPPEPEFDRWTAVLRQDTEAAAAAFVLLDATQMCIKSFATAAGCATQTTTIALSEPLAEYLLALSGVHGAEDGPVACERSPVSVEGQLVGWMVIVDRAGREWGDGNMNALADLAGAVATELKLRLANQEAARFRNLVDSHNRVHALIADAAPLGEVLAELVEGIERYEPSVIPCVVLLDRTANTLHPGAGPSLPPHYLAAINGVVIGPNVGTCGSAAWSGQLTITDDIAHDPKWAPVRELASSAGLGHCWSMPVKAHDGEVLGTLALYGPKPRRPLPEHLALMQAGAGLAGIAIERQRAMEQLVYDAHHDGLTGLPNRSATVERLDTTLAGAQPEDQSAVLFIDLDGLKAVNDTLGHDRADEVLREIGLRLSAAVRADDFAGRVGGDEFLVVAKGASHEQAAALGSRLLEAISEPIDGIKPTVVTASVGIAMVRGSAMDAREAIREADSAMYAAKRAGRDGYSFFEGKRRMRPQRARLLAGELRGADTRDELSLIFEPVFDLATSALVAVEAVPLWNSPRFGPVAAAEFVPIAQDSGTIVSLGTWMLREGCEVAARIGSKLGRPLALGVDVTAHQLSQPGFAHSVHQTLKHSELPVELLALEIAEGVGATPGAVVARALGELDALGVSVVLDDFGSGSSSLLWLKDHPHHGIKIASSFIRDLPTDSASQAVVAAVIAMAAALGCSATALGVDTDAQLQALRELGCARGQGAALGPALTAEQLAALAR
jgi:diguanylate cyclase (GGDEF)-like protein